MIGWLKGRLVDRLGVGEILLDVGGVGYRVVVPSQVAMTSRPGAEVELHVHTHVRDDAIVLYGFPSLRDREAFDALLQAHGVGPSLAVAILSSLGPEALERAVREADIGMLCTVPGVGRKTAERLVLELRDALGTVQDRQASLSSAVSSGRAEVREALGGLGYGPEEIRSALDGLPEEGSVEEMLKLALKNLAVRR